MPKKNEKPKIGDIVWISCRAVASCEGKQATINLKFDKTQQGGTTASINMHGRSIRYVCNTCKRPFHINF